MSPLAEQGLTRGRREMIREEAFEVEFVTLAGETLGEAACGWR